MKNKYTEASISYFKGLKGVRRRPGMYIGGTDLYGLHHLVWEIIDNSIDEVLTGFANTIEIEIKKGNLISIKDNGRGIPAGKHKSGKNTLELIFTELHAGGKFGEKGSAYSIAGGLHGVGAAVVNALSSILDVEVWRNGNYYRLSFHKGGMIKNELIIEKCDKKLHGTKVTFIPDKKIFKDLQFNIETIKQRLKESAFLLDGLKINFIDYINNKKISYHFENNLIDFLNDMKKADFIHNPLVFKNKYDDIIIDGALCYTNEHHNTIVSFVNNIKTINGGTHENGMISGIYKAINKAMINLSLSKKTIERRDILEGLYAIILVRIPSIKLEFEGQTKTKLRTSFIRGYVERAVYDSTLDFLLQNRKDAEIIANKAILSAEVREASRKAKDKVRNIKATKREKKLLSGKLTPAQFKDKKKNEIFVVEGDSAGGTAKLGRDKKFQAVLPLRGKVLNTEKSKFEDVMKNEELSTLIYALGCGILDNCNPRQSNYDKVIIMTDADTDGAHIQALLLTFFNKYMKEMIEAGKIYIAMPPLYKVKYGKKEKYLWNDEDLIKLRKKHGKLIIQRYKGLGEMNDNQLWETTMNPKNRVLVRVVIDDDESLKRTMTTLMGDDPKGRRKWIEENVNFDVVDNFVEFSNITKPEDITNEEKN